MMEWSNLKQAGRLRMSSHECTEIHRSLLGRKWREYMRNTWEMHIGSSFTCVARSSIHKLSGRCFRVRAFLGKISSDDYRWFSDDSKSDKFLSSFRNTQGPSEIQAHSDTTWHRMACSYFCHLQWNKIWRVGPPKSFWRTGNWQFVKSLAFLFFTSHVWFCRNINGVFAVLLAICENWEAGVQEHNLNRVQFFSELFCAFGVLAGRDDSKLRNPDVYWPRAARSFIEFIEGCSHTNP